MGFSISGSVNNAFMQSSEFGLNRTNSLINKIFDIENPDGVQLNAIETQLKLNTTLSSFDASDALSVSIPGKQSGTNVENTAVTIGDQLYNNLALSETFTIPAEKTGGAKTTINLGERPYSLFNKFSLVNYRGTPLNPEGSKSQGKSQFYNKIDSNTLVNPTASKIIELTSASAAASNSYRYDYSDFALTKYFGKIPNNWMITLRRFAFPAPDDIISPEIAAGSVGSKPTQPDIARAITWMSEETGNNIADILKFSTGYNWKDAEAEMQTLQSQRGAQSGKVGAFINSNKLASALLNAGNGLNAYDAAVREANAGYDSFSNTYPNHIFGPVNVIKNVLIREQGMTFEQEFTLKFEYELRDLNGANPKILMLDQLSNILALTYSNAPFWGGGTRYIDDGSVAKPLGDIARLKDGDYGGFLSSVANDVKQGFINITGGKGLSIAGLAEGLGKTLGNVFGGNLMQLFNTPQGGQAVASLLTGDPTGQWHVTIGNPLNPIAVIGNLACTGTTINFEGGMGLQDFPERLVVTVTLKPGRPRDKAEIESMFNSGRGRFYLQPDDEADINNTLDVSAYGNKDKKYVNTFRKLANG